MVYMTCLYQMRSLTGPVITVVSVGSIEKDDMTIARKVGLDVNDTTEVQAFCCVTHGSEYATKGAYWTHER